MIPSEISGYKYFWCDSFDADAFDAKFAPSCNEVRYTLHEGEKLRTSCRNISQEPYYKKVQTSCRNVFTSKSSRRKRLRQSCCVEKLHTWNIIHSYYYRSNGGFELV